MTVFSRLLGPSPLWAALACWGVAAVLCAAAWETGQRFPVIGLLAVGLAPFVALYFFFRGLARFARCRAHWATRRAAEKKGLSPDWACCSGGYLLVDETRGLWVGNGVVGDFADLACIRCSSNGQAHRLELLRPDKEKPEASIGMGSLQELQDTAQRLGAAVGRRQGVVPAIDFPEEP